MKTKYFCFPFLAGFLVALVSCYYVAKPFINSGTDVFEPTYQSLEGKPFQLSKESKKIRLISFWATWCKPCIAEFKDFQTLKDKYPEKLEIITVSDESPQKIEHFRNRNNYSFIFLKSNEPLSSFGINAVPLNVILDKSGRSVYSRLGTVSAKELEKILLEN